MRAEAKRRSGTAGLRELLVEDEWVMQRRGWGGRQEYLRPWGGWGKGRQVAQGIHSFAAIMASFLRLTLQMPCGNPSYKSQLKLTTKPVAVPGPFKLSLKIITAPPSWAKPSLTVMSDRLSKQTQKFPTTTFCYVEYFFSRHSHLGAFRSLIP